MNFQLNPVLLHFLLVTVFSFLIGLEVRTYKDRFHSNNDRINFIGTARTYTFIGMLGFIFYKIEPIHLSLYIAVLISLTILYSIFYYKRVISQKQSILLYLVMLCVYSFGPISILYPLWMPSLLFVLIIFILNAKLSIQRLSIGINLKEFETLGKMVLLSAVILPILPDTKVIPYIPLSPFKIWLAVVVISGISYGGYLSQKYLFPNRGYFVTGIIGGSYSSTATTVVLARKANLLGVNTLIDASIIAATSIMYIRLILVAMVFNFSIGEKLVVPFSIFALLGFGLSIFYMRYAKNDKGDLDLDDSNPLELRTAFIFAFLFVVMMILTEYVIRFYGSEGLKALSFMVGFSDIDPFVLSILTGKYTVNLNEILSAIIIASGSNNLLKAIYAIYFGGIKNTWRSALWISILGILTISYGFFI